MLVELGRQTVEGQGIPSQKGVSALLGDRRGGHQLAPILIRPIEHDPQRF